MTGPGPSSLLARWLGAVVRDCSCGREHRIGVERVLLGAGALDGLPGLLPSPSALWGPVLLLADPDTYEAAGEASARILRGAGHRVEEALTERKPHADDLTLGTLRPALAAAPARIVAVGSGTINDLGKVLAGEAEVPLITVGTAASMNGYTSPIASLTIEGLKITRPARPAHALVMDQAVLAAAPARLSGAGFGDLMSKPVSGADWVLSRELFGEDLCPTALSLSDEAVAVARARAREIGEQGPEALSLLAEALLLSGLSMALAGASSPASGGEHLLSHYLDMSAAGWGREPRLHGEQVAVGTLVSLHLYGRLLAEGPPEASSPAPLDEDEDALECRHRHLGPAALAALLGEARAKRERRPGREERRRALRERWRGLRSALDDQLAGSGGLAEDLRLAGAPTDFASIGLPRDRVRELVLGARHMRDRFTVLDLAADLGSLEELAGEVSETLAGAPERH